MKKKKQIIGAIILAAGIAIFFLTGCKARTVYVPVDRVKTEYKDRFRIDSVYNRDTVHVFQRADTVFKNTIKWRERFVRDTLRIEKTDSIPYTVEVEVPVNYLTKWQKLRLTILNIIAAIAGIYIAFKIGKNKFLFLRQI